MGDIVNLRQVRKRKARDEKQRVAEQNRAVFGRPRSERRRQDAEAERAKAFVDGHRREPGPDGGAE